MRLSPLFSPGNRESANGANYDTDDPNRLRFDGVYTYEYDAEGNRTQRYKLVDGQKQDITDYVWDHRNRLVRVTERDNEQDTDPKITDYLYDAFDRLIGKDIDDNGDDTLDHRKRYVYDGDNVVLEFDADTDGQLVDTDLAHRYLCGPAVDQVFADVEDSGGHPLWYLRDNLGSVRDVARYDDVSQQTTVVNHLVYDAFGDFSVYNSSGVVLYKSDGSVNTDPAAIPHIGFAGYVWDADAGLYYCRKRWYDPAVGRFISEDPIRFAAGDPNLARYVGNSPTNFSDPSGLEMIRPPSPGPIPPEPWPQPPGPPSPGWYYGPVCIGYRCSCPGPTYDDFSPGRGDGDAEPGDRQSAPFGVTVAAVVMPGDPGWPGWDWRKQPPVLYVAPGNRVYAPYSCGMGFGETGRPVKQGIYLPGGIGRGNYAGKVPPAPPCPQRFRPTPQPLPGRDPNLHYY